MVFRMAAMIPLTMAYSEADGAYVFSTFNEDVEAEEQAEALVSRSYS